MSRTTIDFGIDLGTTNSAIAVLNDVTPTIIKNNADQDVTASAVYIDPKSTVYVGERAKNATIDPKKQGDAYIEFKRRMGTEYVYSFKASGNERKPEELSAEVLKDLRSSVSAKLGEEIRGAVVTVPAAFELHQCSATKKAAELAGLEVNALLTEPVAAALAYGFQADNERGFWLVYDFGGGTFDSAVIRAQDGLITVVHHGGDNFLGGADIDWAVLEKIVGPALMKNYDLEDFTRGSARWDLEVRKVKHFIEKAKIELTTKESAALLDCVFEDASGNEVNCEEISITRSQMVSVAEPIIQRSIEICRRVLSERRLGGGGVEKVIVVGGPTKAAYFREMLKEGLGIPLDFSVDPLTVVAQGAAVFAGNQQLPRAKKSSTPSTDFSIDLKYSPVGADTDPDVAGKVVSGDNQSLTGYALEFVNEKTRYTSGRIPLSEDGVFMTSVLAEKQVRNVYTILLYDPKGVKQQVEPASFTYTVGAGIEEQTLINSIGIGRAGNEYSVMGKKGDGLPLTTKTSVVQSIRAFAAGSSEPALAIPIHEGDHLYAANRNKLIGVFTIDSSMIKRDLPAGAELEIKMRLDPKAEEGYIKATVFVPLLDEEFTQTFELRKRLREASTLKDEFKEQVGRLKALLKKAQDSKASSAVASLEKLESSSLLKEIESALDHAKGDVDAAEKAESRILELACKLDELENLVEWPALVKEFELTVARTEKLIEQHGQDQHVAAAKEIRQEAQSAIEGKNADELRRLNKKMGQLHAEVLLSLPGFWIHQLNELQNDKHRMADSSKAERLLDMGQKYIGENNIEGLQNVVRQLWDLLPKADAEKAQTRRPETSDVY